MQKSQEMDFVYLHRRKHGLSPSAYPKYSTWGSWPHTRPEIACSLAWSAQSPSRLYPIFGQLCFNLIQKCMNNFKNQKATQNMTHFPILFEWTSELLASVSRMELPLSEAAAARVELDICDMLKYAFSLSNKKKKTCVRFFFLLNLGHFIFDFWRSIAKKVSAEP